MGREGSITALKVKYLSGMSTEILQNRNVFTHSVATHCQVDRIREAQTLIRRAFFELKGGVLI